MSSTNPYAPQTSAVYRSINTNSDLPVFSKVVFIIDLIFSLLRVLIFAGSLFGILGGFLPQEMMALGIIETIASFLMFAFGIPGNILCLMRNSLGPKLMWGAIAATALSLLIGIAQLCMMAPFDGPPEQLVGFFIGGGFTILLRIGILVAIVVALRLAIQAGSFRAAPEATTF